MSEAAKIALLQEVVKEAGQKSSPDSHYCSHHFGYLGQRSKSEEIPDTCMTCLKLVDCMISKPEASEVLTRPVAPIRREPSTLEAKHEIDAAEETNVPVDHSTRETAKEELKVALEPEVRTKPLSEEPSDNQFKVDNLGMLHASWSKTVRIDRQSLSRWGRKTEEVEVETVKGKRTRCKVQSIEGSEKGVIQVPDKIQLYLGIGRGELVTVRPVTKK